MPKTTGKKYAENYVCKLPRVDASNPAEFRSVKTKTENAGEKKDVDIVYTKFPIANGIRSNDPGYEGAYSTNYTLSYDSNVMCADNVTGSAGMQKTKGPNGEEMVVPGHPVNLVEVLDGNKLYYDQEIDLKTVASIEAASKKETATKGAYAGANPDKRYAENRIELRTTQSTTHNGIGAMTPTNVRNQFAEFAKMQFLYGVGSKSELKGMSTAAKVKEKVGDSIPTSKDITTVADTYRKEYEKFIAKACSENGVTVTSRDGTEIAHVNLSKFGFKAGKVGDDPNAPIVLLAPNNATAKNNPEIQAAMNEFNTGFNATWSQVANSTWGPKEGQQPKPEDVRMRNLATKVGLNAYTVQPVDEDNKTSDYTVINPATGFKLNSFVSNIEKGFAAAQRQPISMKDPQGNIVRYNDPADPNSPKLTTEALFGKGVCDVADSITAGFPSEKLLTDEVLKTVTDEKTGEVDRAAKAAKENLVKAAAREEMGAYASGAKALTAIEIPTASLSQETAEKASEESTPPGP